MYDLQYCTNSSCRYAKANECLTVQQLLQTRPLQSYKVHHNKHMYIHMYVSMHHLLEVRVNSAQYTTHCIYEACTQLHIQAAMHTVHNSSKL